MFLIEHGHQNSCNTLRNLNKEVKVKKNIMTIKQIQNIRDYGCRVLVLFSSMFDNDGNLYVEKNNGEVEVIDMDQLYNICKSSDHTAKLNVSVVFVNVVNGFKIANVFANLGVP